MERKKGLRNKVLEGILIQLTFAEILVTVLKQCFHQLNERISIILTVN